MAVTYLIQFERARDFSAGTLWMLVIDQQSNCRLHSCSDMKSGEKVFDLVDCDELLQCCKELPEVHFQMLVSVPSEAIRLELYMSTGLLEWASGLQVNDKVDVLIKNENGLEVSASGVIRYVGKFRHRENGRIFGVELNSDFNGQGSTDGLFWNEQYFKCAEDGAVFVSVCKLIPPRASSSSSDLAAASVTCDRSTQSSATSGDLVIGQRVVWMNDSGPEFGEVMWIGFLPDHVGPRSPSNLTVGVQFDNPIGTGTGRYKSHMLFEARFKHASLVPIVGLMKASDFYPEEEMSCMVTGNTEKGRSSICNSSQEMFKSQQLSGVMVEHDMMDNEKHVSQISSESKENMSFGTVTTSAVQPVHSDVRDQEEINLNMSFGTVTTSVVQPVHSDVRDQEEINRNSDANLLSASTTIPAVEDTKIPSPVTNIENLCGQSRGIQRSPSSQDCALESVIMSLFAFSSHFDDYLVNSALDQMSLAESIRSVLVEYIIVPIRQDSFVGAEKMKRFAELLNVLQSSKLVGFMNDDIINPTVNSDPAYLVSYVLRHVVSSPSLFFTTPKGGSEDHGRAAHCNDYVYEVDDFGSGYPFLSLQRLLECAVVENPQRRIVSVPNSVFIVGVNSSAVTCHKFPNLVLDIAGLLCNVEVPCCVCGNKTSVTGGVQCGDCFRLKCIKGATDPSELIDFTYCSQCFENHRQDDESLGHNGYEMVADSDTMVLLEAAPTKMNLVSIVSMVDSHFVVFFRVDCGWASEWLMYDPWSGDEIPEIKRCPEVKEWLANFYKIHQDPEKMPSLIDKMTRGLRLCFYQSQSSDVQ